MALFNLRWNSQRSALADLYRSESCVDLTIVSNDVQFRANKLLLCASSPYLRSILTSVPSHHAVLFMPHIPPSDLSNVLKFIYEGEIRLDRRALKSFLETAKLLKIKGMDFDLEEDLLDNESTTNQPPSTQSIGNASSVAASNSSYTASTTNKIPIVSSASEEGGSDKMKILPALLMRQDGQIKQESVSDNISHSSSSLPSLSADTLKSQSNSGSSSSSSGRQGGLSGVLELRSTNNGSNISNAEDDSVGNDDEHNDLVDDMMVEEENENSRSHSHHSHGMLSGDLIDLEDEEEEDDVDHMQDYEDEDEDISILPEVSLQESDESFNINNNNNNNSQHLQQALKLMRTGQHVNSSMGSYNSSTQQNSSKMINKRTVIPKSSSSSSSGGNFNEGILMRMMREPLLSSTFKPDHGGGASGGGGGVANFYDLGHNEGYKRGTKLKRYVQCGSCSKVLSSLSALKRHMEDVHCARIQGKCIICGRVYSSRNSLLTHVYSAHKKHHDYKAVARIIRESDFEKFATSTQ